MDDTERYADLNVDDPDQQEAKTLNLDDETISYLELKFENEIYVSSDPSPSPTPTPTVSALVALDSEGNLTGDLERCVGQYVSTDTSNSCLYYLDKAKAAKTLSLPKCTNVGNYGLYGETVLTSVSLPACTSLGDYAFYGCTNLLSIDLPECRSIGQQAFRNCIYYNGSIDLPKCVTVGTSVFYNCSGLTSVNLPKCTNLGTYAFCGCLKLKTVNLASLQKLPDESNAGDGRFINCKNLETVYLDSCTYIGNRAFYGDASLKIIVLRSETVATLANTNAFNSSSLNIYVPDALVDSYKTAANWSTYADQIKPLSELPTS